LREVKAPTLPRQTANRWRQGCQPYAPAALYLLYLLLLFMSDNSNSNNNELNEGANLQLISYRF
jgi:hypothetical protein